MRIYKSKWFAKFARKEGISDAKLCASVKNAEDGLVEADYGGGLIKQRIARVGEGKSSGYRAIIMYQQGEKAFFVFGFPKNEKENLTEDEERLYKDSAKIILAYSAADLVKYVERGVFKEVMCNA